MATEKKKRVYTYRSSCVFVSDTDPTDRDLLLDEAEQIMNSVRVDHWLYSYAGISTEVAEIHAKDVLHGGPIYDLRNTPLLGPPGQKDNRETLKEILVKPLSEKVGEFLNRSTARDFSDDEVGRIIAAVKNAESETS